MIAQRPGDLDGALGRNIDRHGVWVAPAEEGARRRLGGGGGDGDTSKGSRRRHCRAVRVDPVRCTAADRADAARRRPHGAAMFSGEDERLRRRRRRQVPGAEWAVLDVVRTFDLRSIERTRSKTHGTPSSTRSYGAVRQARPAGDVGVAVYSPTSAPCHLGRRRRRRRAATARRWRDGLRLPFTAQPWTSARCASRTSTMARWPFSLAYTSAVLPSSTRNRRRQAGI